MGWLDGIFGSKPAEDPYQKLDPKLKAFLDKESPVKFPTSEPPTDEATQRKDPGRTDDTVDHAAGESQAQDQVKAKSLYNDGRYADIWKTYQPLEDVEADTKSSHEKLMDVLDGYKERKGLIGKAALENCSLQQEEWRKCMLEGSWADTMTMCSTLVRKFERCYTMQSRFLRVLGYQAEPGRPLELEEDIQLHADSLYQRMIAHEAAGAKAREEGLPVPEFEILPPPVLAKAPPVPNEEVEKMWQQQVDKLPEEERAAERTALRVDYYAKQGTAERLKQIKENEDAERRRRKAEGKATMGDQIWSVFRPADGNDSEKGA